jgi:VWFA-related protein
MPAGLAAATPSLDVAMMARSVPPPDACTPYPSPVSSFATTDTELYLFFVIRGAEVRQVGLVEWRDPTGRLVPGLGGETAPLEDPGNVCFKERVRIAGTSVASLTGEWNVRIYWTGAQVAQLQFSISAPSTGGGTGGGSGGGSGGGGIAAPAPKISINQVIDTGCPNNRIIVSVTGTNGVPITGLGSSNFTVKENGQIRAFTVLNASGSSSGPLWMALLIDVSSSLSSQDLLNEKSAAKQLINQLGAGDQVALFTIGGSATLVRDFTTDRIAVGAAIDGLAISGSTALYRTIQMAAQALASKSGRKAIVLMTGGEDTAGGATLDQAIAAAKQAPSPVFPVGFGSVDRTVLTRIAMETGGYFTPSTASADLQRILQSIGQVISSQYEISYTSGAPGSDNNLEISVTVNGVPATATRTVSRCVSSGGSGGLNAVINQVISANCPNNDVVISVTDSQGNPITGFTSVNFTVKENGVVRTVTVNSSGASSSGILSLAIVLDVSGSLSSTDLANMKVAGKGLVAQLGSGDAVAIWQFDDTITKLLDHSTDRTAINSAIDGARSGGSTAFFDALVQAAQSLAARGGRKAIVVMTDGKDNSSRNKEADAINQARLANAPVFPIGFGSVDHTELQRIADGTGGVYNKSATSADLATILQNLGRVIASQYVLSYASADSTVDGYLEITVGSGGRSAVVTRTVNKCGAAGGTASVGLVVQSGSGKPGGTVEIPVTLNALGTAPAAFQLDLGYDNSKVTFTSSRPGDQLVVASKDLSTNPLSSSSVRLIAAGLNQNPVGNGTVAFLTITLNGAFTAGSTPLACSNAKASDSQNKPLTVGCISGNITAAARCTCDVNGDGSVDVVDVQAIINQALGLVSATCDINGDNQVNVGDVRIVINATLGMGCNP